MPDPVLVYGAYGYTGELVAREAVERGLAPILAGRRAEPLRALAAALGLEHRAFALEDPAAVDRGLAGVRAVLHCAGPFVHTARPMAGACLRARAHYLDITGEIAAFAAVATLGPEAERAGVTLLPGAGYDVVPTDCLAAHLARRLPSAVRLRLGVAGLARPSRGTTRTVLEGLASGGYRPPRGVAATRAIDFGRGPRACAAVPWGDLFTAPRTTGIADVAVYMPASRAQRALAPLAPALVPLLRLGAVRSLAIRAATGGLPGPTEAERARGRSAQWGEAEAPDGARVEARQRTAEPYRFTALAMVELGRRVLAGEAPTGFRTPAGAFGPDLVLAVPGTTREDVR